MKPDNVVVVAADIVTPYGWGSKTSLQALAAGRCAIRPVEHFDAVRFQSGCAGTVPDLETTEAGSRVLAMLHPLLERVKQEVPQDAVCLLATTIGEIEYLERSILNGTDEAKESCSSRLLSKIETLMGLQEPGAVVSSACSSAGVAIAEAASRIADGEQECVLVAACDGVSEFLLSGFASLLALDPDRARPFDRRRAGLSVGEAAGFLLLMSEARARREGRNILGEIAGWGMSNDANHMTGPSRDGAGLAQAICQALSLGSAEPEQVAHVSAHGTGTLYNDAMEMKAFKTIFGAKPKPVYSVKGGMGHTMGAAGLVETVLTLNALYEECIPGTVGLEEPDEDAMNWVSAKIQDAPGKLALSTNSGFGGVNVALLLKRGDVC